jgi:hypothetical protein
MLYPWSQLILNGCCNIHITRVNKSSAHAKMPFRGLREQGWVWLLETFHHRMNCNLGNVVSSAILGHLSPSPQKVQVVGAVRFSEEKIYLSKQVFEADVGSHCIPSDHTRGWTPGTEMKVG